MEPQKGSVSFYGQANNGREPDWVARNGIAHVPEGREIFPFMTVKGNLMMGAYARRDKDRIERDIEVVYSYFPILRERASSAAGYLSGGQQQMLAIGRGLMARPKLMLLDEPSLGLSPLLTKEIFAIIRRLNQEQGVTMLLVEQNANMALKTAHYGYVLETGRIVLEGDCGRLLENDDVREFYLGHKETAVRGKKRWKRTKRWR
jgi:branched-chain amino acid transport system ATP-binding protein